MVTQVFMLMAGTSEQYWLIYIATSYTSKTIRKLISSPKPEITYQQSTVVPKQFHCCPPITKPAVIHRIDKIVKWQFSTVNLSAHTVEFNGDNGIAE